MLVGVGTCAVVSTTSNLQQNEKKCVWRERGAHVAARSQLVNPGGRSTGGHFTGLSIFSK